jgi:hypothetical protein
MTEKGTNVTIHKTGTVKDTMTGKETDGLVVSFGEYDKLELSWKSFKSLLKLQSSQKPTVDLPPRNNTPVLNTK